MGDSVTKGATKSFGSKPEQGRDGRDDPVGLLQTLETSLDDIRTLIICRVCVRDMTQIFAKRAELMPVGETTQEHKKWQEEEAALVEKDRAATGLKGGLFRGCFRLTRRRQLAVIRDDEDGVDRCPRCTWELEDGHCESCGYPAAEDSAEMSDPDGHGHWEDELYDMEGATMEELVGALSEDARMGGYIPNLDFSEHGYSSEDGSSERTPPRMRQRDRRITAQLNRPRAHPEEQPPYDSFLDDTDDGSEDEEVGSLDGFVVNDVEDAPHSVTSSTRSLHWETDEGTGWEGNQAQNADNDQISQDEDGSFHNEASLAIAQYDPEDESDEGPILRSRRQVRRSVASNHSSGSDGSGGSGISQTLNALRVRNGHNGSRVSANAQRNIPHRNPDASGERPTDGPIGFESDSDSPVPAQHTRRRRAIPNRLSLDDDSDVEVSSGTATVGRDSPRPIAGWIARRNGGILPVNQTSSASSPVLIESSPTRSVHRQLTVPGAFPQHSRSAVPPPTSLHTNNSQHFSRAPANRIANHIPQGLSTRRSPADALASNGVPQRRGTRRRSPLPPRACPQSPISRESHSPTAMEMFEQGRRDRHAQKAERRAERRRVKIEREQRGRPQSGLSPSPGSSNQYEDL
ncbi:MAG: hypothetical protein ALECFALPRED_007509 [Alectoria fallacina]|uniref:Uncharacterized protein n=1 Tax=Alectoria fallacina TaxID=1903189 RepID=A0A8H3EHY6_9LECA|nr:MAG: hypothetical protein ALECFALPRED_007509 [Alectoria fallacina]